MAATLLTAMLMIASVCEGVLLRKSTASDFLQKAREKRASECFPGGCSTEVNEIEELDMDLGHEDSSRLLNIAGAIQTETNDQSRGADAVDDEGSGM